MRRPILQLLFIVSAGWFGCSSDRATFKESGPQEFDTPDAAADEPDACTAVSCSRDLRSVLDCNGNIARTCPPDLACGNGNCVSPCDAAAINEGSVGCSFTVPGPNTKVHARGSCYAFFVANNWTSPATLRFEFKGQEMPLDDAVWVPYIEDEIVKHKKLDGPIPPGGGAVVFLSNPKPSDTSKWAACPDGVKPIFDQEQAIVGTGFGNASFVTTDAPVSMYSIYPYGGARSFTPSATLLLPTSSLRKNYVVASAWGGKGYTFGRGLFGGAGNAPGVDQVGVPTLQIVAIEDDTSVAIRPKVDLIGRNGVPDGPRDQVTRYTLQRGEVVQFAQDSEPTGSALESTKPVAVFGGHSCMFVPMRIFACDIDNFQMPPLSSWGSEYAIVAPNRNVLVSKGANRARDPNVVRLVGAADGTMLSYEPFKPEGAPNTLQAGEVAAFFTYEPVVVRSQDLRHPFFVMNVMTSYIAANNSLGDPEVSVAVPTEQWLSDYGFFSDSTYTLSAAFVTRRRVNGAFHDVELDCAGALTGWTPITEDFEWTSVEFTRFFKPQSYAGGTCADGPHRMRSDGPFTMNVWGISVAASYEFAGGMGLRPTTDIEVQVR